MERFTELAELIKGNILFVIEFVGIFIGIFLFAYISERIIKKKSDNKEKILTTKKIAVIGMLSAIAGICMIFEFPLFFIPTSHKLEFGDLPALIGGFAFGPSAAVLIEFCKVLIKVIFKSTGTAFVGELGNYMISCSFVLPATIMYWIKKTKKNAKYSCIVGGSFMVIFGFFLNRFYLLPTFLHMYYGGNIEDLIGFGGAVNPLITNMNTYALFASVPINLLKAVPVSLLTMWLYKPLSRVWKK